MFRKNSLRAVGAALALSVAVAAGPAAADILTFELDTEFSGGSEPAGTAPWVTVTFNDFGGSGLVRLTIETSGLSGSEFLTGFYFNFDPDFDPFLLGTQNEDTSDTSQTDFTKSTNCCKADGDGWFDFQFDFANNDFTAGETWSIELVLTDLTVDFFNFLSYGAGNSPSGLYVAAKIQGIGENGQDSGWITGDGNGNGTKVSEPGTLWLFGIGLVGLGLVMRRRPPPASPRLAQVVERRPGSRGGAVGAGRR